MSSKNKVFNPDFSSLISDKFFDTQSYIEIQSSSDSEVNYEAIGFQGKTCDSAASELIKAVGGESGDHRKNKASYAQIKLSQSSDSGQSTTDKKQNHQRA